MVQGYKCTLKHIDILVRGTTRKNHWWFSGLQQQQQHCLINYLAKRKPYKNVMAFNQVVFHPLNSSYRFSHRCTLFLYLIRSLNRLVPSSRNTNHSPVRVSKLKACLRSRSMQEVAKRENCLPQTKWWTKRREKKREQHSQANHVRNVYARQLVCVI